MNIQLLGLRLEDWLVIITSTILVGALIEIRRLKKRLVEQVQRKFIPQLSLEISEQEDCFYLENSSAFIAQAVTIEDAAVMLQDFGYKKQLTLRFEAVGTLKPRERRKLSFKVYDKDFFLADLTGKIFLHLNDAEFKLRIGFTSIEGLKFTALFAKQGTRFVSEGIECA